MNRTSIARTLPAVLLVAGTLGADPDAPYNYNALARLDQWTAVRGTWSLQEGRLACDAAGGGIALFSDKAVKTPSWYNVSLEIRGLASSPKACGIVVDYRDDANYSICSFIPEEGGRARVELVKVAKGTPASTTTVPLERAAADTVRLSVEINASAAWADVRLDGRTVLRLQQREPLSERFGVHLGSSELRVATCTLNGVAKK